MGTITAPTYSNIFGEKIEKNIYPHTISFSNFYCQVIDGMLFLWNGTAVQLQEFIKKLNNCHPTVEFDFKYSKISIEFVDKNKQRKK